MSDIDIVQHNTFFSLEQVIDRQPITVSVETPLYEAIALMHQHGNHCAVAEEEANAVRGNSSCVLVVEGERLRGIFTERDLVKLVARRTDTQGVTVGEMMTESVVSIVATDDKDIFSALILLKGHRIRHLPVVDESQNLLGLITAKSIRQKLQPINLMKWRKVAEVMESTVIHADPDESIQSIASLMADNKISCVAIAETQPDADNLLVQPIGIITERDIVQFQNLGLDLELSARDYMSAPLFLVRSEDSLWNVYQQMKQRRVRRLLVGGDKGELAGIITQSSLLQVFDPTEMYGAIEVLQRQVCQLETEREVLLQERNNKLEREVRVSSLAIASKNQELEVRLKQQQVVAEIGTFALTAKNLLSISQRVVELVASALEVEYCKVLELCPDGKELLLKAGVGWHDGLVGTATVKADTNSQAGYTLLRSEPVVVNDLNSETRFTGSPLLTEHQVVSGVSVIIPDTDKPYGILGIYTTQHRVFTQNDINFIQAIANTIAQAYERFQVETALKASERKFDSILSSLNDIVWSVDARTFKLLYTNQAAERIYGYSVAEFYQNDNLWLEAVHPDDRDRVSEFPHRTLETGTLEMEYRIVRPDGEIRWLLDHANVTYDANNLPLRLDGNSTDITERKQAEILLRESQERYTLAVNGSSSGLWDWNIANDQVFYAPCWKEILGCTDAELPNTVEAWSSRLHPEDRDRVLAALQDHLERRTLYNIEYRLRKEDGEYCWLQAQGQAIWNDNGQPIRMAGSITDISDRKKRERILQDIASGVSVEVGENFFFSLVEFLSKTLSVNFAFISKIIGSQVREVETLAVYGNGENIDNFVYSLSNAPCGNVIVRGLCLYPKAVRQLFPDIPPLEVMEAESYAGMPIFDANSNVLGLIAVVDSKPFTDIVLIEEVLRIFSARASTELERKQAELALKQSEEKFRVIFDRSFQFIGLLEPNGKIIEANQTALDFVGLKPVDVRGKPFWDTPWWSGSLQAQKLLQRGIEKAATGEFVRFEVEHPGTDNRVVTVDFSLTPIKDEAGKVMMLIPEGRNISDRKQAEASLEKSNLILQAISSIQTQFLTDIEAQIIFDGMLEHLLELTESEYGFIGEIHVADDGSRTMAESYMKFRGRPFLKTHAITNIAWNKETRAFYAENAPKGMEFHNLQTLFGAVIVTGEPVIANSPSDDPRRGGLPDGHPPLNAFLGVPFYKNGQMTGMAGIANRIGGYDESTIEYLRPLLDTCSRVIEAYKSDRQRQQIEAKIREQAALLDIANEAIMVRDSEDRILFWNRGAEKLYGWSKAEVLNKNAKGLFNRRSTVELSQIHQAVRERGEWQGELNQVTKTDREIVVNSRWTLVKDEMGNLQAYLVVKTDITEQKQLEAQFLRTQRLESLGTLAGGIAHDLNNILAPILGFSKLLPLKLPDVDEQTKGFFKIMENNANRGSALVKQILTFSRGLEGDKGVVQVRHLITEVAQIINETFPKSIELEIDAPKTLWTVNADINQLHQVLMNLSVNARDAMPDGGKLRIDAENTTVDAEYARLHLDATEGSYVSIAVSDTGVGIPHKIIDRIFEPFFTTKEVGRGTGLGLSTVIGIIKSHDGFVEVISDRKGNSKGTQFKVFLPASDLVENNEETTEEILQGNGELVLVVDDETAILQVTKATLETYNYQVLTANNGIEAIATYARERNIAVVIMDIMMPSMDGKTAIRTIKQIDPEVKIIAVSGLIERQEIVSELDGDVIAFLNKPYSNDDLLKMLHEMVSD